MNFMITLFDTCGKEIKYTGQPKKTGKGAFQFSVKDLSPGMYVYSLNGKNRHYQGKFTVSQ
jgi:hypothetical protein